MITLILCKSTRGTGLTLFKLIAAFQMYISKASQTTDIFTKKGSANWNILYSCVACCQISLIVPFHIVNTLQWGSKTKWAETPFKRNGIVKPEPWNDMKRDKTGKFLDILEQLPFLYSYTSLQRILRYDWPSIIHPQVATSYIGLSWSWLCS